MRYCTLTTLDNHSDTRNNTPMHTANTKLQIVAELQLEVRSARTRAGLTLAEAGMRLGYPAHRSAEDMERLETLEPSNTNSHRMLVQHLTSALTAILKALAAGDPHAEELRDTLEKAARDLGSYCTDRAEVMADLHARFSGDVIA